MNFDDLNQIPWDETTRPAPELVAQVRDALWKQLSRHEREGHWIAHCQRLLKEGDQGE